MINLIQKVKFEMCFSMKTVTCICRDFKGLGRLKDASVRKLSTMFGFSLVEDPTGAHEARLDWALDTKRECLSMAYGLDQPKSNEMLDIHLINISNP